MSDFELLDHYETVLSSVVDRLQFDIIGSRRAESLIDSADLTVIKYVTKKLRKAKVEVGRLRDAEKKQEG